MRLSPLRRPTYAYQRAAYDPVNDKNANSSFLK